MPKDIQHSGAFNTGGGGPYRPPEFFDDGAYKKGDIDKYHGQHRLVAQGGYKRLKKMQEGILLVRFEMPFDVWCDGCGELISMGVRFGECEKTRRGNYFSTPLYRFRIRHHCGQWLCIENDPRNTTYNVTEGGRRKATPTAPDIAIKSAKERAEARLDAAATAEVREAGAAEARETAVALAGLKAAQDRRSDSHAITAALQERHRLQHGLYLHRKGKEETDLKRVGVVLQDERDEDVERARNVNFSRPAVVTIEDRLRQRQKDSIFAKARPAAQEPRRPRPDSKTTLLLSLHVAGCQRSPVMSVPAAATHRELTRLLLKLHPQCRERKGVWTFAQVGPPGAPSLADGQRVGRFARECGVGREEILFLAAAAARPQPPEADRQPKRARVDPGAASNPPDPLGLSAAYT
eukprot:TRINITY_DN39353_c0_g1_i1.p1 TRINITY_DN39353_c0_g1~~TRINITY_DN39353_c0_g1_i1.p1  ORF type:complete len:407 (+),score=113.04 TRINITY_DN39353_c0_g1_i1:82-1302(+)